MEGVQGWGRDVGAASDGGEGWAVDEWQVVVAGGIFSWGQLGRKGVARDWPGSRLRSPPGGGGGSEGKSR